MNLQKMILIGINYKLNKEMKKMSKLRVGVIRGGVSTESVEEKLIELGLAPEKIIETKGNGDLNPVASNDTEEGRAANRRIEVQFVN